MGRNCNRIWTAPSGVRLCLFLLGFGRYENLSPSDGPSIGVLIPRLDVIWATRCRSRMRAAEYFHSSDPMGDAASGADPRDSGSAPLHPRDAKITIGPLLPNLFPTSARPRGRGWFIRRFRRRPSQIRCAYARCPRDWTLRFDACGCGIIKQPKLGGVLSKALVDRCVTAQV